MPKIAAIYEQLTIEGSVEYQINYTDGSTEWAKEYPEVQTDR
jgi:hypothetical protein